MTSEEKKEKRKQYKLANREKILAQGKLYRQNNKEKIKEARKKYKPRATEISKIKKKLKRQNDPIFRLNEYFRKAFNNAMKTHTFKGSKKINEIVGFSGDELRKYIENKFEPWMNWQNYGCFEGEKENYSWDIDHIIPISTAKTEDDVKKLNHYSNLQPLCSFKNRRIKRHGN